jgi:hypothetical protein
MKYVIACVLAAGVLAIAGVVSAQTSPTAPGFATSGTASAPGSSSATFTPQGSTTPSPLSVVTTPPPSGSSITPGIGTIVPGGTLSSGVSTGGSSATAPTPARTGPLAPQEVAVGLLVLMIGALVVNGMPKPGLHAKGYRR